MGHRHQRQMGRQMGQGWLAAGSVFGLVLLLAASAPGQQPPVTTKLVTAEGIEFFEKKVRPLFAAHCTSCHSGEQPLAGLRLDTVAGIRTGGVHGALFVPGKPESSRLIQAVRGSSGVSAMPPSGPLASEQIAVLEEWVRKGAMLPEATPATYPTTTGGFPLTARRKHWAYQPFTRPAVPPVQTPSWVKNPVDAFVLAKLEKASLRPSAPADRRTLIRRVTFDLTGLPPTPAEVEAFVTDSSPNAYEKVVDRLLASPHYGERWGRHWLDLMRYGESLGHEFDFTIPNAYQYRDYVIRALNADVPYDQFLREHLAGDMLPEPRRNPKTGQNEAILGTGFFWLGEGKHSPVDIRQEQADRIDNQIDVLGKAFLAQTIACARCHDHKFDPIPTTDYYALYGILKSSRYQQAHINPLADFAEVLTALDTVRSVVHRPDLKDHWTEELSRLPDTTITTAAQMVCEGNGTAGQEVAPLSAGTATGEAFQILGQPGEIVLSKDPSRPVLHLLAKPTAHSAYRSPRLEGAFRTPTFTLNGDFLHLYAGGVKGRIYLIIENFTLIRDPIYGPLWQNFDDGKAGWRTVDVRMWRGRRAYLELHDSTLPLPAFANDANLPPATTQTADQWVMLEEARLSNDPKPPARFSNWSNAPAAEIRRALAQTLERWGTGAVTATDAPALATLNLLLRDAYLTAPSLKEVAPVLTAIEAKIPVPVRAPAMCEGTGEDEAIFVRGDHRTPGPVAPRLGLTFCNTETKPLKPVGSGRLQLAQRLTAPDHPLTARVLVNRLWKHHFGTGLVATVDDFGHMGEKPTHPELLNWLASEFVAKGWSLKKMHRLLVLSSTYRQVSTRASATAESRDPDNRLLHRMNPRRLEAEAVRDAILAVSGRLDRTMYGPSIYPNLPVIDARGGPPNGPLDGNGRRTIYLAVRRNFLSPFLLAFDFPTPFTCIGRRTVSNIPAQALALMNGPFVRQQAQFWAERICREMPAAPAPERITALYHTAYGRPPTLAEQKVALAYLDGRTNSAAYTDLCHALFNVKEFVYVR